ncbi:MAG: zf-HC2 domain-containing protein [Pyrinomonadaceae bacterium]|nr:zf-HC2 domain-containing protein [Pyrinomonadaceae bacterium]MDQ3134684.1 zf-HC2 domain-containing protein [Acidobacteriota bacterium]
MDCADIIQLLSDYHDGALDEMLAGPVRTHLVLCLECGVIFNDLTLIVTQAVVLREGQGIALPDENVIWQRIGIIRRAPSRP